MKKHDDFDDFGDDILGGGDMSKYETYESLNIDEKIQTLTTASKKFIESVAKVQLENLEEGNEDYVKAISELETSNLLFLLKQVKYSEHVLDSLMRQLDNGGYMEPGLFETIRVMQKSGIEIALEVSKYLRTLPEYFKWLKKDLVEQQQEIIKIEQTAESTRYEDAEIVETDEQTAQGPIRGTRDLMLDIIDSRTALQNALENIEQPQDTPIIIDENGHRPTELNSEDEEQE